MFLNGISSQKRLWKSMAQIHLGRAWKFQILAVWVNSPSIFIFVLFFCFALFPSILFVWFLIQYYDNCIFFTTIIIVNLARIVFKNQYTFIQNFLLVAMFTLLFLGLSGTRIPANPRDRDLLESIPSSNIPKADQDP